MARSKNTTVGRAGEYFAAHIFETAGIEAYRVDGDFDLVISVGGHLISVEVKSAVKVDKYRPNYYAFKAQSHSADMFCFVALDLGLAILVKSEELGTRRYVRINKDEFTHERQKKCIEELKRHYTQKKDENLCLPL